MSTTMGRPRGVVPRVPLFGRRINGGTVLRGVLGFVLFFLVLELLSRYSGLSEQVLPRATTILAVTASLPLDTVFMGALGQTLWATFVGLALATLLAVPTGIALGTSNATYKAVSALMEIMRPVPPVALIPPVLLMMGAGPSMKIFLVTYSTFWIILFNTIYGIRGVDPATKDAAKVFGTSPLRSLVRVSLPGAAPFIFTGIQIAATAAFLVTIGTEMLAGGSGGLGAWLVTHQASATSREYVFGGAFLAGVIGLLITGILVLIGRRLFPWSIATRGGAQ